MFLKCLSNNIGVWFNDIICSCSVGKGLGGQDYAFKHIKSTDGSLLLSVTEALGCLHKKKGEASLRYTQASALYPSFLC